MRIEDVGSSSVAGDLLAFALTIIITFSVITSLEIDEDENEELPFVMIFRTIVEWSFLDPDGDGFIQEPDRNSYIVADPVQVSGYTLRIGVVSINSSFDFMIEDGFPALDLPVCKNVSEVHSFTTLIEMGTELFPCLISIVRIEVVL